MTKHFSKDSSDPNGRIFIVVRDLLVLREETVESHCLVQAEGIGLMQKLWTKAVTWNKQQIRASW